jgi:hypothetical protein
VAILTGSDAVVTPSALHSEEWGGAVVPLMRGATVLPAPEGQVETQASGLKLQGGSTATRTGSTALDRCNGHKCTRSIKGRGLVPPRGYLDFSLSSMDSSAQAS